MKPDVLKDISHVEGSMLVISFYDIFGPFITHDLYHSVYSYYADKGPRN